MKEFKIAFKQVKNNDVEQAVFQALDLINPEIKTETVLIKPDLQIGGPPNTGLSTNVYVIDAIIQWLKRNRENVTDITIAEGSAFQNTKHAFQTAAYHLTNYTHLKDLNQDDYENVKVKNALNWHEIKIAKTFLNAEYVINAPVAKCHALTGVSLGIENLTGVLKPENVKGNKKYKIHEEFTRGRTDPRTAKQLMEKRLIDLYSVKPVNLTVMDGTCGLEKHHIHGTPVQSNFIITSEDAIAADVLTASVMGFKTSNINYLQLAQEKYGNRENHLHLLGDVPTQHHFTKPAQWMLYR